MIRGLFRVRRITTAFAVALLGGAEANAQQSPPAPNTAPNFLAQTIEVHDAAKLKAATSLAR